jgi:hypothetical protein
MALVLLVAACDDSRTPAGTPQFDPRTKDDFVLVNAQTVAEALARYSADHAGEYPRKVSGSFVDYLPDSNLVVNPFTGERSEPRDWRCQDEFGSGQIIYRPQPYVHGSYPYPYLGYVLHGYGRDGEIVELTAGADSLFGRSEKVIANCYTVRDAVEQFALDNGGVYPDDLADTDQSGNTVIDLLPEGRNLLNPYHLCYCEPQDGAADEAGETGYIVVTDWWGNNVGYVISGWGWGCEIFELQGPAQ